jgi:hypothetical protein
MIYGYARVSTEAQDLTSQLGFDEWLGRLLMISGAARQHPVGLCARVQIHATHQTPARNRAAMRRMGRRWLAVAATALVTGVYAAQVVVAAAETSPAPIAGIAPVYGPKTVSAVPNAAAIVRRIWLSELDAGYDPQGLAAFSSAVWLLGGGSTA